MGKGHISVSDRGLSGGTEIEYIWYIFVNNKQMNSLSSRNLISFIHTHRVFVATEEVKEASLVFCWVFMGMCIFQTSMWRFQSFWSWYWFSVDLPLSGPWLNLSLALERHTVTRVCLPFFKMSARASPKMSNYSLKENAGILNIELDFWFV